MANEKRLIDANEVERKIGICISSWSRDCNSNAPFIINGLKSALERVVYAPTVDAVEVVRCKDCKSWEQYNACDGTKLHRCMNHDAIFYKRTKADDFCSYGERREGE